MEEEPYNPYDRAKRASQLEKQKREQHLKYNSPQVIINDDPVIPDFPIQDNVKRNSDYNMKVVVVGDGGCGKTCLLVSYVQRKFPEIYVPTVFENYVAHVASSNGKLFEVALWDTAGQEEYDRLRPLSYPDADVILICFALDNLTSLQNVKDIWYPEVAHFCPGIPILLVGTKADLKLGMDPDVPIQLATEINAIGYIQCSAKRMFNINTVFNFAIYHFQRQREYEEQIEKSLRNRLSRALHSRNLSGGSNKKHNKSSSIESSKLLERPLAEEEFSSTYQNYGDSRYNEEEFAFTRKSSRKKRKCTIL